MLQIIKSALVAFGLVCCGIGSTMGQMQTPTMSGDGGLQLDLMPFAPTAEFVENGPIAVRVLFVGRNPDGKRMTVSAEITNRGPDVVYVAVVGPHPGALDNTGRTYNFSAVSGLGRCESFLYSMVGQCFKNSNYCIQGNRRTDCLPGDNFSQLNPGASSLIALSFADEEISETGFLSLTMNLAMATGVRPGNDRGKHRDLVNLPVSFPLVPLGN